jgi:spore coat polysaccharide biosynthesis protein SpsF
MTAKWPRTVAVIQARCNSSRLPAKVLADVGGEPMLARVVARVRQAKAVDDVYVATSTAASDDPVAALARGRGWPCVRGPLDDVLERFRLAADASGASVVIRITADCPFIDPEVIDRVVTAFRVAAPPVDYASNVWPSRTYARGLDTEVFTREALERAAATATLPGHREHVTQFIYQNENLFRTLNVTAADDTSHHRWTVDTEEDMRLARVLYEHLRSIEFRTRDVLTLLEQHPEWTMINATVKQKEV